MPHKTFTFLMSVSNMCSNAKYFRHLGLKSKKSCNLGKAVLFASEARINVFLNFFERSSTKEGACGVKKKKSKNVDISVWG